jgi:hypothetical protein
VFSVLSSVEWFSTHRFGIDASAETRDGAAGLPDRLGSDEFFSLRKAARAAPSGAMYKDVNRLQLRSCMAMAMAMAMAMRCQQQQQHELEFAREHR